MRLVAAIFVSVLSAAQLEISRPVRAWEFLDALGPKAGILGREDGTLEGYVYPLKIFKDLRLRFWLDGRVIPGESVARRIVAVPGSYTIIYAGDEYEVTETLVASPDQPGGIIRLQVAAHSPLRVDVEFARDFQLMWPAAIGTSYGEWSPRDHAWFFGADGHPFAAVFGSRDAELVQRGSANTITLGEVNGRAERVLVFAGSVKSRQDALTTYNNLLTNAGAQWTAAAKRELGYLDRTVSLDLPDKKLQAAYDWSRLSVMKGMVENPLLGTGLVAGYGLSKDVYRPGFAWFFGRDTFWTSFALTSAGDFASARTAIEFIAKYQRADGKIPHEIAQTASLIDWFKDFPYGYASADATPLFVIAVQNYVQQSGDVAFARTEWPRLQKAFDFMRANMDSNGFPKNFNVGHGWVEGGPLLPVQLELYQAGCYVEALRSMAALARMTGDTALASQMDAEFQAKQKVLEGRFWLPQSNVYAFALDTSDKAVDQPTVLSTVPMWFGVLDPAHALSTIERLSTEDHAADWGMRIISTNSPKYGPEGYHYGTVWPLFTGWASVGEYRYHAAAQAFANLQANAWLVLDGAGGNPTEVLSGMTYSPLSTASPHQIWSAAMVVSPLLRGLCGLDVDATRKRVTFAPHVPVEWKHLGIKNVNGTLDFTIDRDEKELRLRVVNHGQDKWSIDFAPAYWPATIVNTMPVREERTATDLHPHYDVPAKPGVSTVTITHRRFFGYSVPYDPPQFGAYSENLKVVKERWNNGSLELTVSGRSGHSYRIGLVGADVPSVEVEFRGGDGYLNKTVTLHPSAAR